MRLALGYRVRHARDVTRDWFYSRIKTTRRHVRSPEGFVLVGTAAPVHRAMQSGTFDSSERAAFTNVLQDVDRLIDVGANIGLYCAMALQQGVPVLAVEPQELNFNCLEETLRANGWSAEIFRGALGATAGMVTMYGASSSGASLIRGWAGYSPRHQQTVPMTTLDALIGDRFRGEQLLIKVDVEGAEADVIAGGAATLQRNPKPWWLVEICLTRYHPGGNKRFLETFNRFFDAGYRAYCDGQEITSEDVANWMTRGDAPSINFAFCVGALRRARSSA